MPIGPELAAHMRRAAVVLLMAASCCSQLPPASAVAIPPVPPGEARIWIYRNDTPQDSQERPYLRLNGEVAGIAEPDGAFYRDLPPGHYRVSVDSYGAPYANQFAEIDLATAGETAFVEVSSMQEKVGGPVASRTFFFTRSVPADAARAAIARSPFYGGS